MYDIQRGKRIQRDSLNMKSGTTYWKNFVTFQAKSPVDSKWSAVELIDLEELWQMNGLCLETEDTNTHEKGREMEQVFGVRGI